MNTYFIGMKNPVPSFLGDKLRLLRLEKGLTQTQLGEKVGLSKRMMAHYEKHATRPPTDKVMLLAHALGIKIEDLLKSTPISKMAGTDPKFSRKLEKAKRLPQSDKQIVTTMIDSLLKKNKKRVIHA
ncbi:MAG: helix-turn-helix transcriptional regulator [Smithella sp.]|nr:helix-turn-helix transcriptional regulator [Smithella sp.]MDD5672579.1 helix-turn-helix transcriptional regulator [Chitinivibrionales bacterium]